MDRQRELELAQLEYGYRKRLRQFGRADQLKGIIRKLKKERKQNERIPETNRV